MSNIQFTGTLFKPELRYTPEGKAVYRCSVAMYTGKDADGKYKPSVYIRVTAFGELAEQVNRELSEKMRVTVTGQVEPTREWTGNDGKTRTEFSVIARAVVQGNTIDEKVEEVW